MEHYPTAWQEVGGLAERLEAGAGLEEWARLDAVLTSTMPALNSIDHRPVFDLVVRDEEAFRQMEPAACGYGVLEGVERRCKVQLKDLSQMYCVGCQDCVRYFESSSSGAKESIADIEDTAASASTFFSRIDQGNRRRIFEDGASKRRRCIFFSEQLTQDFSQTIHTTPPILNLNCRQRAPPLRIQSDVSRWVFRCWSDEDFGDHLAPLDAASRTLERLEEIPGVDSRLREMPAATVEEAKAEAAFMGAFLGKHGGPEAWLHRARATAALLVSAADDMLIRFSHLETDLSSSF